MKRRLIFRAMLAAALMVCLAGILAAAYPIPGPPPALPKRPSHLELEPAGVVPAAYLPLLARPFQPAPWVNTSNRDESGAHYRTEYLSSEGVDSGWTGHHSSCNAGDTSEAFRQAIMRRLNYFRSMAGIPALAGFNPEYNSKAQAAALMMSANRSLSHTPPMSWTCYSAAGHEGAGSSNLYLGVYGPSAISGYIYDPGGGNYFVGHRRWILYPQTLYMGTGDIPPRNGYPASNALWVFDLDNMWGPRPDTRDGFVAWPAPGYVPYQVVNPRWSFAFPGADFSQASVSMTRNGQPLQLTLKNTVNGYGENTLVWEPNENSGVRPEADTTYHVVIGGVSIDGFPSPIEYDVILFDPES